MKIIQLTALISLFAFTAACADNKGNDNSGSEAIVKKDTASVTTVVAVPDSFQKGKVITPVVCKTNSSYSYALYIPLKGNQPLPVIYFFDPHGDGALPLNKYKELADRYQFILIGSNDSKNGNDFPIAENIWNSLFTDSKNRLKIDAGRIYTCGFSGGAKVAGYIALNHPEIKSVIVGGAGLPDNVPPSNFRFDLTTLAGTGDLNMTDLVAFDNALNQTQTAHRIISFNGKHEWAPVERMDIAFAGLQLNAMRKKQIDVDNSFVDRYSNKLKKEIDDYAKTGNFLSAVEECVLATSLFNGISTGANWFKEKENSIRNNPSFQKQSTDRQNLLSKEQSIKAGYQQQFESGDMNYWKTTIAGLQTNAKGNSPEAAMSQRLIAYLSLAFYSISNQLIKSNRDKEAAFFVELYKLDDATNPESWYLSAILNARNNNAAAARDDLLKAVANSFNDKTRMEQQPEFQTIRLNFADIEANMKK
ncbi:MAG: hypothetical protein QM764_03355 [Chitinophagaceae bacterium]